MMMVVVCISTMMLLVRGSISGQFGASTTKESCP